MKEGLLICISTLLILVIVLYAVRYILIDDDVVKINKIKN